MFFCFVSPIFGKFWSVLAVFHLLLRGACYIRFALGGNVSAYVSGLEKVVGEMVKNY